MPQLELRPRKNHFTRDAYLDFELSREAQLLSPQTLRFYQYTCGKLCEWLERQGAEDPKAINASHVRAYLAEVAGRGLKSSSVRSHAVGIRAFLTFCHDEGYSGDVRFAKPKVADERPPMVSLVDLQKALRAARKPRDAALLLVLVDYSGLRRGEAPSLVWGDVDISTGVIHLKHGKGNKDGTTVIGARTRRALLKWRRRVPHEPGDSVFGLTGSGVRQALRRLGDRAGVKLTAHALRRSFATMSLAGGISPFHLKTLMGHADLSTTRRYLRLPDEDLRKAHEASSPVDRMLG